MRCFGLTDVGCVRESNQDFFRIEAKQQNQTVYTLLTVCDGMGGAKGGETASSLACNTFTEYVLERLEASDKNALLTEAVQKANAAVFSHASKNKELAGMGTTLCAVLTDGENVYAVSIGDSRIYLFTNGSIVQLSHDHSYVQVLVDSGAITKDESRMHPNKNIITRAVGTRSSVECDSFRLLLSNVEGMLLCSDGLTNFVSDEECLAAFSRSADPEIIVSSLVESAKATGGGDNITAVLLHNVSCLDAE